MTFSGKLFLAFSRRFMDYQLVPDPTNLSGRCADDIPTRTGGRPLALTLLLAVLLPAPALAEEPPENG